MKNQAATAPRPITRIAISMITSLRIQMFKNMTTLMTSTTLYFQDDQKHVKHDINELNSKSPQ
jgi:hypothetical protein